MSQGFDVQLPPFIVEETVTSYSDQRPVSWGVSYLQAPEVWKKTTGEKAIVFVIDTEDYSDHEALAGSFVATYSYRFTNEPETIESLGGHGLHVADTVKQVAPGVRIYGAYKEGYAALSGTSMASPHVAGVLALTSSYGYVKLPETLKNGAKDINTPGFDDKTGFGAPIIPAYFKVEPPKPEPEEPNESKPIPNWAYWASGGVTLLIILYFLLS